MYKGAPFLMNEALPFWERGLSRKKEVFDLLRHLFYNKSRSVAGFVKS